VVTATDKLEFARARTDGPEVPALLVTDVLETSLTDPKLLDALIAHTKEPNAVVLTVVLATDKPENALAKLNGAVALAATEEESLELVTHVPTVLTPTLLTEPHPALCLYGLQSLEFWPQYALSSWSWRLSWSSGSTGRPKKKPKQTQPLNSEKLSETFLSVM